MRIAEMETHHQALEKLEAQIAEKEGQLEFRGAFDFCQASLPHIEPAFRLRKKRGMTPEAPPLRAFGILWKYGPPLFEREKLIFVRDFIASSRFLSRHENDYLSPADLAVEKVETARILWNRLEIEPGFPQRMISRELGIEQDKAVDIVETWERLCIIDRTPEKGSWKLRLRTMLEEPVVGICLNCGLRVKGRKEILLQPVKCQKCTISSYFHLRVDDPSHQ